MNTQDIGHREKQGTRLGVIAVQNGTCPSGQDTWGPECAGQLPHQDKMALFQQCEPR
jgi:hypothetical protein